MARRVTKIILLAVLLALLWDGTSAQSGCTTTLRGLIPCLNYVNGNSPTPSSSCCSQLSGVVQSQSQCLCLLLNGPASSYGFNVNQTLAFSLPGACKVQTPPASRCNELAAKGPTASPATPLSPPADTSEQPNTKPSGSNVPSVSKSVPSENGGSSIKAPCSVAVILLFIASYALSGVGFSD